jgi:hypothetical protein
MRNKYILNAWKIKFNFFIKIQNCKNKSKNCEIYNLGHIKIKFAKRDEKYLLDYSYYNLGMDK